MGKITEITGKLQKLTQIFRSSETISWKMQQLRSFVQEAHLSSLEEYELDDLLETIDLVDYSSKRLKLELASNFHRPLLILEFLKSGEKLLVQRSLQMRWIFQLEHDSPLTKPKTLVRIILPNVSYFTRIKIIRNLALFLKDEQRCENIFKLVHEKFGVFSALPLLSSCSSTMLREFLLNESDKGKNFMFMQNSRQFLKIAEKDGKLMFDILAHVFQLVKGTIVSNESKYHATLEYLCMKDPGRFSKFYENWKNVTNLNWFPPSGRTTKGLLLNSQSKQVVFKNAIAFEPLLDSTKVAQLICPEEFTKFFESLLPATIEKFMVVGTALEEKWINKVLPNLRWEILNNAFANKYGKGLEHFDECIINMSPSIMSVIPVKIRQKLRSSVYKNMKYGGKSYPTEIYADAAWNIYYNLSTEDPVKMLSYILENEQDLKTHSEILQSAIKSCCITANYKTLIQILECILIRGQNNAKLRNSVLFEIWNQFEKNWTITMWKKESSEKKLHFVNVIERLLLQINGQSAKMSYLLRLVIGMKLSMDVEVGEEIEKCYERLIVETIGTGLLCKTLPLLFKSYEIHEKLLSFHDSQLARLFPVEFPIRNCDANDMKFQTIQNAVLAFLQSFKELKHYQKNWFRKHFKLSDYPWTETFLTEILEYHTEVLTFEEISHIPNSSDLLLANQIQIPVTPGLLNYIMLKHPETIIDQLLDYIIDQILISPGIKQYTRFLELLKTQGFSQLSTTIVEICLVIAQDDTKDDLTRCNAITILSILWDSENFLNSLCLFYSPASSKVEMHSSNQEFEMKHSVRKNVLHCMKNTANPTMCISILNHFFIGEHANICIEPLALASLHAPQLAAVKALKEEFLLTDQIQAKKKVISLLVDISEVEEIYELLLHLWDNESHHEIREYIMKQVLLFISFQSNNALLNSFTPIIKEFLEEDLPTHNEGFDFLLEPKILAMMSKPILLWYIQTLYFAPEKVPIPSMTFSQRKHFVKLLQVLGWIHNNLTILPPLLIKSVIDNHFLSGENDAASTKMVMELLAGESQNVNVRKKLMQLNERWDKSPKCRSEFRIFILKLCKYCLGTEKGENATLVKTLESLEQLLVDKFDHPSIFVELMILQLTQVLIMMLDEDMKLEDLVHCEIKMIEIGRQVRNHIKVIVNEYGSGIIEWYCKTLNMFFHDVCKIDPQDSIVLDLLVGIVVNDTEPSSEEIMIVTCSLLPRIKPKTPNLEMKYEKVVEMQKSQNSKAVKAILFGDW